MSFLTGVLVFGAAVFCFLVNLCYLAVEKDVRILRAYLVLKHSQEFSPPRIQDAIGTLGALLEVDARKGGRPILLEDDYALIRLQPELPEPARTQLAELLARKTGQSTGWKSVYFEGLPVARSPLYMPELELSLLYYAWVIEIATLIFLSQSLRRPHVQEYLHGLMCRPVWFLPVTTVVLAIPLWRWAAFAFSRPDAGLAALTAMVALGLSGVLFLGVRSRLTPQRMNDLGFYILISSLFVQLLTMMGDPDLVYPLFSSPEMQGVRYVTWFILLCLPLNVLEKWYRTPRGVKEAGAGHDIRLTGGSSG
ncbi:MAG: hypothetical protein HY319_16790 [Armatimonadetes bacterium]|nr:hypothetical protein [Armatimonadota bacterium]